MFTTEVYDKKRYLRLQAEDQVRAGKLLYEESPDLFLIGPKFVRRSMKGRFDDAVIIIGGCQSLALPDLGQAFLDGGASAFIGWNGMVDLSHNNETVLALLRAMTVDGLSPQRAVEESKNKMGPDPIYKSYLDLLPPSGAK